MDDPRNEGKPITEVFLRALPKTDVHLHLDGSVRIQTLIDLAKVSALSRLPQQTFSCAMEEGVIRVDARMPLAERRRRATRIHCRRAEGESFQGALQ
jgi:hypothetical protein